MESKKGLTGERGYAVEYGGGGRLLHSFTVANGVTVCGRLVRAGADWSVTTANETAELCEHCFDEKGNPRPRAVDEFTKPSHRAAVAIVEGLRAAEAAGLIAPADERTLFVQARGSEFWHIADRSSTPSLDARTICGARWGGDGWNMGTQNPFGPPRKLCKSCAGVLAAQAQDAARARQEDSRAMQSAARAEILVNVVAIVAAVDDGTDLDPQAVKLFAQAVEEYLKAEAAL